MKSFFMNLEKDKYEVVIEDGLLSHLFFYFDKISKQRKLFVISDTNVWNLYGDMIKKSLEKFTLEKVIITPGEASKSYQKYLDVIDQLLLKDIHRGDIIIGFGGGVVLDLSGFIAATLYRGMELINIPTSLIADLDSSIGGKTGIDYQNRKNVIGAFKQPSMVLIDPLLTKSLSKGDQISGMGELVKHALIYPSKLITVLSNYSAINEETIYESLLVKRHFVSSDIFDVGERMILNFGHTFGHLVEMDEKISHGLAVSKGILMAIAWGIDLKITPLNVKSIVLDLYAKCGLPITFPDYKKYLNKISLDKKNISGTLNFIFLKDINQAIIKPIVLEDQENECCN